MLSRLDRVLPVLSAAPATILSAGLEELHQVSRYELSLIQWRHDAQQSRACRMDSSPEIAGERFAQQIAALTCAECGHYRLNADQARACCTMQGTPCPMCEALR